MVVFEVISKLKKRVRLTEIQWAHIHYRHKELENQLQNMTLTLTNPDFILHSPKEENYHYYKRFTQTPITEKYLLLVVKHLDKEGFIITAFFVSKIRKENKVFVYGEKNFNKL